MIMNQSGNPTSSAAQRTPRPHRRPASIAELAARAQNGLYDERRDLKQHLRAAEKNRRTAKELHKAGDLEAAFVEYAKAATLVLEKVPTHRDYHTLTNDQQRNLALVRLSI
jgi:STAM-binding protein